MEQQRGFSVDIGKIGVPDSVLLKPSALTSGERGVLAVAGAAAGPAIVH